MKVLKLSEVVILADRQRKEFDENKLRALARSISSKGLMKPICVQADGVTLIAGERRLRALQLLVAEGVEWYHFDRENINTSYVPAITMDEFTPDMLFEAELDENLHAVNLSWQELTQAQIKLHKMRAIDNPEQTMRDTAKELVLRKLEATGEKLDPKKEENRIVNEASNVRESLILEEFLTVPEVANAKTKKEAVQVANRLAKNSLIERLAKQEAAAAQGAPIDSRLRFYRGPLEQNFAKIELGGVDLVLVDPPYGVEAHNFKGLQGELAHQYDDSAEKFIEDFPAWAQIWWQLLKKDAHLIMFFAFDHYPFIVETLTRVGFSVRPKPLIWNKRQLTQGDATRYFPSTYEPILMARKGDPRVVRSGTDILEFPYKETRVHEAQKPVDLYIELIERLTHPGDLVVDTMAGGGTIFRASAASMRRAVGFEQDEKYANICEATIASLRSPAT